MSLVEGLEDFDPGSWILPEKSHPSNEQRSWLFRGFVGYKILPSHISTIINHDNEPYCWWKKSCTTWDVKFLLDNPINHQSTGAGFLPSTLLNNQYILESIRPFFFVMAHSVWHGSIQLCSCRPAACCIGARLEALRLSRTWFRLGDLVVKPLTSKCNLLRFGVFSVFFGGF